MFHGAEVHGRRSPTPGPPRARCSTSTLARTAGGCGARSPRARLARHAVAGRPRSKRRHRRCGRRCGHRSPPRIRLANRGRVGSTTWCASCGCTATASVPHAPGHDRHPRRGMGRLRWLAMAAAQVAAGRAVPASVGPLSPTSALALRSAMRLAPSSAIVRINSSENSSSTASTPASPRAASP